MINKTPYMFVALRRKKDKDNEKLDAGCVRVVGYKGDKDGMIELLNKLKGREGLWRLHRSVNRRSLEKAKKDLLCSIIKNDDSYDISNLWESILMQPWSNAEKKWLIDIDNKDQILYNAVVNFIKQTAKIFETTETPNGYHLVVSSFDTRGFNFDYVEIKKDALFFLGLYTNKI